MKKRGEKKPRGGKEKGREGCPPPFPSILRAWPERGKGKEGGNWKKKKKKKEVGVEFAYYLGGPLQAARQAGREKTSQRRREAFSFHISSPTERKGKVRKHFPPPPARIRRVEGKKGGKTEKKGGGKKGENCAFPSSLSTL